LIVRFFGCVLRENQNLPPIMRERRKGQLPLLISSQGMERESGRVSPEAPRSAVSRNGRQRQIESWRYQLL